MTSTVLIVDDEPKRRRLVGDYLATRGLPGPAVRNRHPGAGAGRLRPLRPDHPRPWVARPARRGGHPGTLAASSGVRHCIDDTVEHAHPMTQEQ
ncbi:hypothetical protein SCATT_27260 [Streptantibioticus cattleyicolor NRRL 8057 = DSM 46488]|uniref:Uncharacterized protein n=1 Tax=Streptantibioticus cattleyicolor (strain ATCC 35852 / DSM 46488 / JCM 4925 / NBRC 14057 / NRRL 8057) TaxID=1003195 RepID=G8X2I1_STREN|nr:hypothetical protein SCATT_27260 [Streptantibioticus cattleyicolor NRRL 8057 = DSM 46488]